VRILLPALHGSPLIPAPNQFELGVEDHVLQQLTRFAEVAEPCEGLRLTPGRLDLTENGGANRSVRRRALASRSLDASATTTPGPSPRPDSEALSSVSFFGFRSAMTHEIPPPLGWLAR
jgi:hypothetical protein